MANVFSKWIQGLDKTRKVTFGRIAGIFGATEIKPDTWDDLEALLIQADLGIETTQTVIDSLKQAVRAQGITQSNELESIMKTFLASLLSPPPETFLPPPHPNVILMVGVNGSGKTTTTAKLASKFSQEGKKVILGAADTFRAAAIDQLQVWGQRLNIPVIAGQPGGDSAAVAYDTIQSAISNKMDIAIIDTAGRLHTRYNLMEELKKVHRVSGKALPGAPSATWLVLDATTGQNALQQARAFREAVSINGIILAKLDSSAKGGMAFAIQRELNTPIVFAGLGEKPEDLVAFDREAFVEGIFNNRNPG
ncbi:MAG: signal recognition particle-docking protein FtsY [Anaerolineae bacterium]|nr:signal recognition particle-docking protein FtsY [Anaerolineae bacterium]